MRFVVYFNDSLAARRLLEISKRRCRFDFRFQVVHLFFRDCSIFSCPPKTIILLLGVIVNGNYSILANRNRETNIGKALNRVETIHVAVSINFIRNAVLRKTLFQRFRSAVRQLDHLDLIEVYDSLRLRFKIPRRHLRSLLIQRYDSSCLLVSDSVAFLREDTLDRRHVSPCCCAFHDSVTDILTLFKAVVSLMLRSFDDIIFDLLDRIFYIGHHLLIRFGIFRLQPCFICADIIQATIARSGCSNDRACIRAKGVSASRRSVFHRFYNAFSRIFIMRLSKASSATARSEQVFAVVNAGRSKKLGDLRLQPSNDILCFDRFLQLFSRSESVNLFGSSSAFLIEAPCVFYKILLGKSSDVIFHKRIQASFLQIGALLERLFVFLLVRFSDDLSNGFRFSLQKTVIPCIALGNHLS